MTSEAFRSNPLFLRNQFESDGVFEMPVIRRQDIDLSDVKLIGYDQLRPDDKVHAQSFVHFFLDDYKFEVIWNDPEPRLPKLSQYKGILSPQFSTYYTMPVALQIHNTFRSRWCGAYLQSKGFKVIPTVSWGQPESYWYCFDGIEEGSVVALSTLGVKKEKDFFLQGYNEMLRRIKPKAIICYSDPFPEMQGNIITIDYAQTNRLGENKMYRAFPEGNSCFKFGPTQLPETPQEINSHYQLHSSDYFVTAGMGGGGSRSTGINLKPKSLMDELANSGNKYTPENVVSIAKTSDGKLIWIEKGNQFAGLRHIENHASQFAAKGISVEQIPEFITIALTEGNIVGMQGTRPIYEVVYNGQTQRVAITIGRNGFIVGANPVSLP